MGKKLQLTFDDGPLPRNDALVPILNEVKGRKVVAGFFVLGQEVDQRPDAAKEIIKAGHVLGNHSWDHLEPKTSDYTDDEIVKEFQDCHDTVANKVGVTMMHWRAPRLDLDGGRLPRLLSGSGKLYSLSHCDIAADSKDSQGKTTAAGMLDAIRADLAKFGGTQGRLLFHVKKETAAALKDVLDGLVKDGHTFVDFGQAAILIA
ncbi:polysaccharide deacetylase family protein [Mesorhizobium sp. M0571]|uniref:polysaccharide deacetylase family protein n=1 Tax=Mesorhizobium sp. M0571 TaxID=2956960 RepID=UPI00333670A0